MASIDSECRCLAAKEYTLGAPTGFPSQAVEAVAASSGEWNHDMVTDLKVLDGVTQLCYMADGFMSTDESRC